MSMFTRFTNFVKGVGTETVILKYWRLPSGAFMKLSHDNVSNKKDIWVGDNHVYNDDSFVDFGSDSLGFDAGEFEYEFEQEGAKLKLRITSADGQYFKYEMTRDGVFVPDCSIMTRPERIQSISFKHVQNVEGEGRFGSTTLSTHYTIYAILVTRRHLAERRLANEPPTVEQWLDGRATGMPPNTNTPTSAKTQPDKRKEQQERGRGSEAEIEVQEGEKGEEEEREDEDEDEDEVVTGKVKGEEGVGAKTEDTTHEDRGKVQPASDKEFEVYTITKRFSEMEELHTRLRMSVLDRPHLLDSFPKFPGKATVFTDHLAPEFVNQRKLELQAWLRSCLANDMLKHNPELLGFLKPDLRMPL